MELTGSYQTVYSDRFRKGGFLLNVVLPNGEEASAREPVLFSALLTVRKELEGLGIFVAVWGAKRSVWPSGMQADMGGGLEALDRDSGEVGDIFQSIDPADAATVEEQKFHVHG